MEPSRIKTYYLTAILSLIFAVVGFSYNAWRLEVSEDNNNIRTAAFEVLSELAELEQLIYAAHYDKNPNLGNPRNGWVKVGLIVDLSLLIDAEVEAEAVTLKQIWSDEWSRVAENRAATDRLVEQIKTVRQNLKQTLADLQ